MPMVNHVIREKGHCQQDERPCHYRHQNEEWAGATLDTDEGGGSARRVIGVGQIHEHYGDSHGKGRLERPCTEERDHGHGNGCGNEMPANEIARLGKRGIVDPEEKDAGSAKGADEEGVAGHPGDGEDGEYADSAADEAPDCISKERGGIRRLHFSPDFPRHLHYSPLHPAIPHAGPILKIIVP